MPVGIVSYVCVCGGGGRGSERWCGWGGVLQAGEGAGGVDAAGALVLLCSLPLCRQLTLSA